MYCNSDNPIIEPLLTADQVAERLSCSKSQAHAMMRRNTFPVVRMGRMIRVKQSSLEAYIDQMEIDNVNTQSCYFLKSYPLDTGEPNRRKS